jgi:hypothetical protein
MRLVSSGQVVPRRGSVAQQKDGFHQVTRSLLDGQGRELGVVHRALGHHPIHGQLELLADLRHREFGLRGIAPALERQQLVAVENGDLSAFDGNVHAQAS